MGHPKITKIPRAHFLPLLILIWKFNDFLTPWNLANDALIYTKHKFSLFHTPGFKPIFLKNTFSVQLHVYFPPHSHTYIYVLYCTYNSYSFNIYYCVRIIFTSVYSPGEYFIPMRYCGNMWRATVSQKLDLNKRNTETLFVRLYTTKNLTYTDEIDFSDG